jgi:hypothetical protein
MRFCRVGRPDDPDPFDPPGGDDLGLADPGGPERSWSTRARARTVLVWRPVRSSPSSWKAASDPFAAGQSGQPGRLRAAGGDDGGGAGPAPGRRPGRCGPRQLYI